MARSECIYFFACGNPAGSREHVWPASLGGRRVNKKILCANCNQRFKNGLDKQLADDFRFLNTLVEVRSDHQEKPHALWVTDSKTGQRFLMRAFKAHHGEPKQVRQEVVDGERVVTYELDDRQQEEELFAMLRAKGTKFRQISRTVGPRFIPRALHVDVAIGGDQTFRALARLSLNFLAHFYPALARDPGLRPLKQFVLGAGDNTFVFYDFDPPALSSVPTPPPLQHRVVVWGVSDGGLFAHLALFGVVHFSIRMGAISGLTPRGKCVLLNPAAERAGDSASSDLVVHPVDGLGPIADFRDMREADREEFEKRIGPALRTAYDRKLDRDIAALLHRLSGAEALSAWQQRRAIREALEPFLQQILNVIVRTVEIIRPAAPELNALWDEILSDGPENEIGVSPLTANLIHLTSEAMIDRIADDLRAGPLSDAPLRRLLDEDEGIRLACRVIMSLVRETFGSENEAES